MYIGGADTHTTLSGVAHRAFDTELDALRAVRYVTYYTILYCVSYHSLLYYNLVIPLPDLT